MVSTFTLLVPDEDRTQEAIDAYYDLYLEKTGDVVGAETRSELVEYRQTRDRFREKGHFWIYQELRTSIAERLETPPHAVFAEYGDGGELWNDIGLAALDRLFQDVRRELEAENEFTYHHDLYGYEALIGFAITHGYGISYP